MEPALIHIWSRIRDELALLQDQAPEKKNGQVVNPISGAVYSQNTVCAALVFATEYTRSNKDEWRSRAHRALESLTNIEVHLGLDEPKWNRLGWHYNRGSMFTTGTFLDVLWKTRNILSMESNKEDFQALRHYIDACRIMPGSYSHDIIKNGHRPSRVQNTTAIASYLLEEIAKRQNTSDSTYHKECNATVQSLLRGQRHDGFWPYVYPTVLQRLIFRYPVVSYIKYVPIVRRFFFVGGDSSIFFGDAVHHCLVLYYLAKSVNLRGQNVMSATNALTKGWKWIEDHLTKTSNGGLRFNFDWEPAPSEFRYANFRDTSTYFIILAMLPLLVDLGTIDGWKYNAMSDGLLKHVECSLLQEEGKITSIMPYEGPESVLKWILPRVGEASAWKGALLAEFVLSRKRFNA